MAKYQLSELDDLYERISSYSDCESYMTLLDFIIDHPYMAPYNAALVYLQRPNSSFVTSAKEWEKHFHRYIKPGAQPIVIMVPFGPVGFRYDFSQTDGSPDDTAETFERFAQSDLLFTSEKISLLLSRLPCLGIRLEKFHFENDCYAGCLQVISHNETTDYASKKFIYKLKAFYYLRYEDKSMENAQIGAIMHELGHYFCRHLPNFLAKRDKTGKEIGARYYKLSYEQMEFEAESVAYMVCKRLSIPTDSEAYLNQYKSKNGTIPKISPDIILKAAGAIESLMDKTKHIDDNVPKELIVSKTARILDNSIKSLKNVY